MSRPLYLCMGNAETCHERATLTIHGPDGVMVPGGYVCPMHGVRFVEEYAEKLGEAWQLRGIPNPEVARFRMTYEHCSTTWRDEWSSACNSQCPVCGTKDIEPTTVEDVR